MFLRIAFQQPAEAFAEVVVSVSTMIDFSETKTSSGSGGPTQSLMFTMNYVVLPDVCCGCTGGITDVTLSMSHL